MQVGRARTQGSVPTPACPALAWEVTGDLRGKPAHRSAKLQHDARGPFPGHTSLQTQPRHARPRGNARPDPTIRGRPCLRSPPECRPAPGRQYPGLCSVAHVGCEESRLPLAEGTSSLLYIVACGRSRALKGWRDPSLDPRSDLGGWQQTLRVLPAQRVPSQRRPLVWAQQPPGVGSKTWSLRRTLWAGTRPRRSGAEGAVEGRAPTVLLPQCRQAQAG